MLRYLAMLAFVSIDPTAQAAEAAVPPTPVELALTACAAMQERFAGTECTALRKETGYQLTVKAANPDAMRVVFMRSIDIADALCAAGYKVALNQQLETSAGTRIVRWAIDPQACGIKRVG